MITDIVVQAAVIPFSVALVVGMFLRRFGYRRMGLTVVIGFLAGAYVIHGPILVPLTSTRKLILCALLTVAPAVAIDARWVGARVSSILLSATAVISVAWMLWPLLLREPDLVRLSVGLAACAYVVWLTVSTVRLSEQPLHAGVAVFALGVGTAGVALIGASALLAQLALAIAASAAAYVVLAFVTDVRAGAVLALPIAVAAGLIGVSGSVFARIPWYSLVPLMAVTALVHLPIATGLPRWRRGTYLILATAPAVTVALLIAWWVRGAPPL